MCGICGLVRWDGGAGAGPVREMAGRLAHRGPDGAGTWSDPGGRVVLGHRRLAVLDLSDRAAQPMVAADGHALVYNGECYGHRELARELEGEGATFRSTGDTEVVLEILRRWGAEGLQRLDGMFALALWSPRGSLLLARDRLGIKPLFWAEVPGGLVFASEVPALLAHPDVGRAVDSRSLGRWLQLGYVPGARTLLSNVNRLEPGTLLEASPAGMSVRRWYDPLTAARRIAVPRRREEAAEALETLVRDAVRRRLEADVPRGCFLSSGVDSTLVTAAAAAEEPLGTLTVRFEGGEDESGAARETARRLGLDAWVETLDPSGMLELLDSWPRIAGDPFADPSFAPTMMVSAAARRRWTVALSGDGGDELFSGYRRLRAMPRLERILGGPPLVRGLAGLAPLPRRRWAGKLRDALKTEEFLHAYQVFQGLWPGAEVASLLGEEPPEPWPADVVRRVVELPPWTRWRALDLLTFLPERVLAKVDRCSMAHGLEVRVPLLDHRIVEFALALPERLARDKRLLRDVLRRVAPGVRPSRRKVGFEVPLARWLRGPLRGAITAAVNEGTESLGLDPGPARDALEAHLTGRSDRSEPLFALWLLWRWCEAVVGT